MSPKRLRDFRCPAGKDVLGYCARQPGVTIKYDGRHPKVIKPGYPPVPVPFHGSHPLPTGTWHAIFKQLVSIGITVLAVGLPLGLLAVLKTP